MSAFGAGGKMSPVDVARRAALKLGSFQTGLKGEHWNMLLGQM